MKRQASVTLVFSSKGQSDHSHDATAVLLIIAFGIAEMLSGTHIAFHRHSATDSSCLGIIEALELKATHLNAHRGPKKSGPENFNTVDFDCGSHIELVYISG